MIGATADSLADVQVMSERLGLEFPVLAEVDRALVVDGLGPYPLDRRGGCGELFQRRDRSDRGGGGAAVSDLNAV